MTSRWQTIKANLVDPNTVKPWDMLNPNTVWTTDEKKETRLNICRGCPEFISLTTQCKQCGCIMKMKTALENAVCPLSKW